MSDDIKHEWADLDRSPGFARLRAHAEAEWSGPAFVSLVEQLADKPTDAEALSKLRQMLAAKRAVERLLSVPAEQVKRLERQGETQHLDPLRRRGSL
jgi:hypothetical protein